MVVTAATAVPVKPERVCTTPLVVTAVLVAMAAMAALAFQRAALSHQSTLLPEPLLLVVMAEEAVMVEVVAIAIMPLTITLVMAAMVEMVGPVERVLCWAGRTRTKATSFWATVPASKAEKAEIGSGGGAGFVYKGTMSPNNGMDGRQGNGGQGVWLSSGNGLRIEMGAGAVIQGRRSLRRIGIEGSASQSFVSAAGTISGGRGSHGTHAAAISINGTNNVLQLLNGYHFVGGVNLGTDATLTLAGAENSTFDLSWVGTQFQGFNHFLKDDQSTWTLSGKANTKFKDVTVSGGVLALGPDQTELQSDRGLLMAVRSL